METKTPATNIQNTCGHEFTHETVHSGSWRDGSWEVSPRLCANCNKSGCDECSGDWETCSHCLECICDACEPTARRRHVTSYRKDRMEYLCSVCCARQDAAKVALEETIYRAARREAQILLDSLTKIKHDAIDAERTVNEQYPQMYPQQAGAFEAHLGMLASEARITRDYSSILDHCSVDVFAGKDAWLDEVVNELEEAIRKAKKEADL